MSSNNSNNSSEPSQPENKRQHISVAGFASCGYYKSAKQALVGLQTIFPNDFQIDIHEYEGRDEYLLFLKDFAPTIEASNHKTSPIVWLEEITGTGIIHKKYLGGRDDTLKWVRERLTLEDKPIVPAAFPYVDVVEKNHSFDYDLVVIGGGSGGLACSKEASKLGAKVAVLDYVKPSPAGSKWGLGGTCVNVGCIPKKLFHQSALLGEHTNHAIEGYGWLDLTLGEHHWQNLVENVQNHIKGLNFGYRVDLREKGVTYLNQLGKFISPHQLECVDNKGKKSIISAQRFVIATGGRPSPLAIPGGELAISSDDIFSLKKPPGKTCVIGAGYVALECAGFLTNLKQGEVTVLVRSRPLRTFDRDTVQYVIQYMTVQGTKIVEGVQPLSIEKLPSGKLLVTWTGGVSEEFDTVLAAIGRTPDLTGLNLSAISPEGDSVKIHPSSGKIVTNHEQTTIPHIYAIGDVVHDAPELTPVAILAGKLLARRLFHHSHEVIQYTDIATAVFTPLELGTVGLSEEEAIQKFGADNIESYCSAFKPLEWTLVHSLEDQQLNCFTKIVVVKNEFNKTKKKNAVVGLHIAAPNAGEIIQGFGLALKKGLTYEELQEMVGIHPTVGEEFTLMTITKSSGIEITKTGC